MRLPHTSHAIITLMRLGGYGIVMVRAIPPNGGNTMYQVIRLNGHVVTALRSRPMAEQLAGYLARVLGRGYAVRRS